MQAAQSETTVAPRSIRHSADPPASWVNDHDGFGSLPGVVGDEVIDGATGAAVSSVYVPVPAVEVFPAASVAVTSSW